MTLSTGPTLNFFGDHVFAWSGQEDLTAGVTTLLDFISPNRFYSVVTNVSFDYSGCSKDDVLSWTVQGNGEALHVSKFVIIDAGVGPQFPNLYYTIPPNTGMKILATGPTGKMTVVLEGKEVQ
jgi:hypothetical protein